MCWYAAQGRVYQHIQSAKRYAFRTSVTTPRTPQERLHDIAALEGQDLHNDGLTTHKLPAGQTSGAREISPGEVNLPVLGPY